MQVQQVQQALPQLALPQQALVLQALGMLGLALGLTELAQQLLALPVLLHQPPAPQLPPL